MPLLALASRQRAEGRHVHPPCLTLKLATAETTAGTIFGLYDLFSSAGRDWVLLTKGDVTKDAIWVRDASLVGLGNPRKPQPADAFALAVDPGRGLGQVLLPKVRMPREEQQDAIYRQLEIDPAKYTPKDVQRPLVTEMPSAVEMFQGMLKRISREGKPRSLAGTFWWCGMDSNRRYGLPYCLARSQRPPYNRTDTRRACRRHRLARAAGRALSNWTGCASPAEDAKRLADKSALLSPGMS